MKQKIREAREADIPQLVEMGLRFISEGPYREKIKQNPERLSSLTEMLITNSDGKIFVLERGSKLTGMIGLLVYLHPMSGEWVAGELAWWVEPNSRGSSGVRLLKRAERWAREAGAEILQMIAPSEHVASFYVRMGYEHIEDIYHLRLNGRKK